MAELTIGERPCGCRRARHPDQHGQNIYLWGASTRQMVASRLSNSIGLASNSSHPCGDGLLALALNRMRGHADDRDVPGLRIVLETPHSFPTVVVRHFEVHQDHVRVLARGQTAALLAVLRCENLKAAAQLEARLEHVQVVVVVFDVKHFGHDSVLLTAALITSSLDHLVGRLQPRLGDGESERLRRLEVDDQLELARKSGIRVSAGVTRYSTPLRLCAPVGRRRRGLPSERASPKGVTPFSYATSLARRRANS